MVLGEMSTSLLESLRNFQRYPTQLTNSYRLYFEQSSPRVLIWIFFHRASLRLWPNFEDYQIVAAYPYSPNERIHNVPLLFVHTPIPMQGWSCPCRQDHSIQQALNVGLQIVFQVLTIAQVLAENTHLVDIQTAPKYQKLLAC